MTPTTTPASSWPLGPPCRASGLRTSNATPGARSHWASLLRSGIAVIALALAMGLVPVDGTAQSLTAADVDVATVDATSVDAVIEGLYASISGPAGAPRDWDLFLHLMHPAGQLISMRTGDDGEAAHTVMTPQDFVDRVGPGFVENGFFDLELGYNQDEFGNMVHRFSAYASRRAADDPEPYGRGVNSFQLLWDEGRWWIISILWDGERPENPIPAHLGG